MRLQQQFDRRFVRKFTLHQRIGEWANRVSIVRWIVTRLGGYVMSVGNDIARRRKLLAFQSDLKSGNTSRHGYTRKHGDLRAAIDYAEQLALPDFPLRPSESHTLYTEQLATFRGFLPLQKPPKVFNFGVCYAHVDATLAREFPAIEFVGIDLGPHTKMFNEAEFPDIRNLTFLAGDVFAEWKGRDYTGAVLFHSRTLVLLPKGFIEKLYRAAHEAGFGWIIGFEQNGLSEETMEPFTFETADTPSVYWRDGMYNHNYLGIAEAAGFAVCSTDLIKTQHSSPDLKVLRFVARRR